MAQNKMNLLKLKQDPNEARIQGLQPEVLLGIIVVQKVYEFFNRDCVITSITDSKHMSGSLHYVGYALDLGILPVDRSGSFPSLVIEKLKECLNSEWDVVLEGDHIHMEFQPKRGLNLPA